MNESERTKFSVRVNRGPEQSLEVATSIYQYAVAAVPAFFNIEREHWPILVEIWFPELGKDARHHHMLIHENEFGNMVIATAAKIAA